MITDPWQPNKADLKRAIDLLRTGELSVIPSPIEEGVFETLIEPTGYYTQLAIGDHNEIRDALCTCPYFRGKRSCIHTAATYNIYGKYRRKSDPEVVVSSIRARDIIDNADDLRLRSFIKKEVMRNKYLEIRLKATFIDDVFCGEGTNKYDLLLSELVKESPKGGIRLSKRGVALLKDIALNWLSRVDQFLASGLVRDAADILIPLLRHLHRFADKSKIGDESIIMVITDAYERLQMLAARPMAPELRHEISEDCVDIATRSYYVLYHSEWNMFPVIINFSEREVMKETVLPAMLARAHDSSTNPRFWWAWAAILSTRLDVPLVIDDPRPLEEDGLVESVLRVLEDLHAYDAAGELISAFSRVAKVPDSLAKRFNMWRFKIARLDGDKAKALDYGIRLLITDPSAELYETLTSDLADNQTVNAAMVDAGMAPDLAAILDKRGDSDALLALISEQRSVDLVLEYLDEILAANDTGAFETIWDAFESFINRYAGSACTDRINELLESLSTMEQPALTKQFLERLHNEFPGRFDKNLARLEIS